MNKARNNLVSAMGCKTLENEQFYRGKGAANAAFPGRLDRYLNGMKTTKIALLAFVVAGAALLTGCETLPPNVEHGPHGTIAYIVPIDASPPGAKIEVNGQVVGNSPVRIKIFGDRDGTFHDFGSYQYVVRALPLATNQYPQTAAYGTGRMFSHEDRIPDKIYFDMTTQQPAYPQVVTGAPAYGPPFYYYGPSFYFGPPVYYGPRFQFWFGPRYHHGLHRW